MVRFVVMIRNPSIPSRRHSARPNDPTRAGSLLYSAYGRLPLQTSIILTLLVVLRAARCGDRSCPDHPSSARNLLYSSLWSLPYKRRIIIIVIVIGFYAARCRHCPCSDNAACAGGLQHLPH